VSPSGETADDSFLHQLDLAAGEIRDAAVDACFLAPAFVETIGDSPVISILLIPVACVFYLLAPRPPS
jgi:hypothetical protein